MRREFRKDQLDSKSSCEMRVDSASGSVLSAGPEVRCRTASAAHSARLLRLESPALDDSLPQPVSPATSGSEPESE